MGGLKSALRSSIGQREQRGHGLDGGEGAGEVEVGAGFWGGGGGGAGGGDGGGDAGALGGGEGAEGAADEREDGLEGLDAERGKPGIDEGEQGAVVNEQRAAALEESFKPGGGGGRGHAGREGEAELAGDLGVVHLRGIAQDAHGVAAEFRVDGGGGGEFLEQGVEVVGEIGGFQQPERGAIAA